MPKEIIEVKIDNSSFNATHFAGWKEADFIKHELKSVPDNYGSDDNKVAFLKSAFEKIQEAVSVPEKTSKAAGK